jgi:hypothetical protein
MKGRHSNTKAENLNETEVRVGKRALHLKVVGKMLLIATISACLMSKNTSSGSTTTADGAGTSNATAVAIERFR